MDRRTFLALAATPAVAASLPEGLPKYHVVSHHKPAAVPGMPGRYAGHVVRVHGERAIDTTTEKINAPVIQEMISQGMRGLTGMADARDAWRSFFEPSDVVGIKVNCSGAPGVMSSPYFAISPVRTLTRLK